MRRQLNIMDAGRFRVVGAALGAYEICFCVAGATLGPHQLRFAWQVQHLEHFSVI